VYTDCLLFSESIVSQTAWWIFLPACIGMNFFPGPNNLVALVHGTETDAWRASLAGLARLPVMILMLMLLAVGLEVLLATSAAAFQWIRLVGALYLLWMAWRAFTAHVRVGSASGERVSLWRMARTEALIAGTNPKLILIFYAFFPQFVNPSAPIAPQIVVMGGTFLLIEIAAIALYAYGGQWLARLLSDEQGARWVSRITGVALASAACLIILP
jgi:threonine/homoserine/homoserine lactone efflux protein